MFVFRPPLAISLAPIKNPNFPVEKFLEQRKIWMERLKAFVMENGHGNLKGRIIKFPISQSYLKTFTTASHIEYMILSRDTLIIIPNENGDYLTDEVINSITHNDVLEKVYGKRMYAVI